MHGNLVFIHFFSFTVAEFYVRRGELFLKACDFQSAMVNYRKGLRLDKHNSGIRNRLALILFIQGRVHLDDEELDEAVQAFGEACKLDPDNREYPMFRIKAFIQSQRYNEALEALSQVLENIDFSSPVELAFDSPELPREKPLAKIVFGDHSTSTVDSTLAPAKSQTFHFNAIMLRAKLYIIMHKPELAQKDIGLAHRLRPGHPEIKEMADRLSQKSESLFTSATAGILVGNYPHAIDQLSRSLELNPNSVKAYKLRASVLRKQRRFDAALTDLKIALKICHDKMGAYEKATSLYEVDRDAAFERTLGELGGPFGLDVLKSDARAEPGGGHLVQTDMDNNYSSNPFSQGPADEIKEQLALTFNDLALEYHSAGNHADAINCLCKAIETHRPVAAFYINRGDCYRAMRRMDLALADYRKVQTLAHDPITFLLFVAIGPWTFPRAVLTL